MIDWKKWRHVTKLDPDKPITKQDVAAIVDSGTDAIMVSGTQNITKENVANLVNLLSDYRIPKVLEPAGTPGMRDDLDFVFIPSVFNTKNSKWLVGMQKDFVRDHNIDLLGQDHTRSLHHPQPLLGRCVSYQGADEPELEGCSSLRRISGPVLQVPHRLHRIQRHLRQPRAGQGGPGEDAKCAALLRRRHRLAGESRDHGEVCQHDRRRQRRLQEGRRREAERDDRQVIFLITLFFVLGTLGG